MRPRGRRPGQVTHQRPSGDRYGQHTCPSAPASEEQGPTVVDDGVPHWGGGARLRRIEGLARYRLKNERVHGTRYATRAEAEADLFEYIAIFYNRRRRHSTLGYSSPTQFLSDWLSKQADQQPKAA